MPQNFCYLPEGKLIHTDKNMQMLTSFSDMQMAQEEKTILEAQVILCDYDHNLIVDLGNQRKGIIPHDECALGIKNGNTKEIAIISRVGRPVCFIIKDILSDQKIYLSRLQAQEQAQEYFFSTLTPGDIIPAKVTHLEKFGAFVDIGCGIISLIGIENISVSRISHPGERFREGQDIFGVVVKIDPQEKRIHLSHRELLGTWEDNIKNFSVGETVIGVVRSIEKYGVFIELSPNLSGLAEPTADLSIGQTVSVYIKSISSNRMKIKLVIIDQPNVLPQKTFEYKYHINALHMEQWVYTPEECKNKYIFTNFK